MLANGMLIMTRLGVLLDVKIHSRIQIMQLYSLRVNWNVAKVHSLDNQVVHV
jgi:hypothetical protein